jgi:hypothetical protein
MFPQAVRPLEHCWHVPPMHAAPEAHWPAPVPEQLVRQAFGPHTNGVHMVVVEAGQLPRPSQAALLVAVPLLHAGCRQVVSAPGRLQVDLVPLQAPWQAPVPAQAGWPARGAPVTKPHVPGEPPLQDSHDPLQAALQQTVSAQKPLRHCEPVAQVCPVLSLHAPVASQLLVPLQLLSGSSALVRLTQLPFAPVQLWHVPHDAVAQQNPSTHALLVHSVPDAQPVPFPFFGTHVPPLQ